MPYASFDPLLQRLRRLAESSPATDMPDRKLLERFTQNGDAAAFEELLRRHGGMVLGVCRRLLRDPHDADDAFQATFLTLARKANRVRQPDALGPWLYRVATCAALQARHAAARRAAHERLAGTRQPATPLEEVSLREAQAALDEELAALPERCRAPLVLCYLQGRTRDEAAAQLGWSLGTLKRRLERGRALLRTRLTRRGFGRATALSAGLLMEQMAPAAVPTGLCLATARACVPGGLVPPVVASLADAVSHSLFSVPVRTVTLASLCVVLLAAGTGAWAYWAWPGGDPPTHKATSASGAQQMVAKPHSDLYGDPLPRGALVRMGTNRLAPGNAVAFTADGKTLISANDSKIWFWDAASGRAQRQVRLPAAEVAPRVFTLTPDGKTFAADQTSNCVLIWDVAANREVRRVAAPRPPNASQPYFLRVALSPDGSMLAALYQARTWTLGLWNLRTGRQSILWQGAFTHALAFSSDGRALAAGDMSMKGIVKLFDTRTGKVTRTFRAEARGMAFTPDGKRLAIGDSRGTVIVWNVATGEQRATLHRSDGGSTDAMVFSKEGKTLVAGGEKGVCVWDLPSGRLLHHLQHRFAYRVALSPDGKTVASSAAIVRLWDLRTGKELFPHAGHQGRVSVVAFSPDGQHLASASDSDGTVRLWDTPTGKQVRVLSPVPRMIRTLEFTPDGRFLLSDAENEIIFWDVAVGKPMRRLVALPPAAQGQVAWVRTFHQMADGRHLAAVTVSGDLVRAGRYDLIVGDMITGKIQDRRPLPSAWAYVFTADGASLATGDRGAIQVVDTAGKRPTIHLGGNLGYPLAFSPDGRLLAAGTYTGDLREFPRMRGVSVRELDSEREVVHLPTGLAPRLAFSPDGRFLVTAGPDALRLWELATGKEVVHYETGNLAAGDVESFAEALAFAPDGRTVTTGLRDTTILLWDMAPGIDRRKVATTRTAQELDRLWTDLASPDSARAFRAGWTMTDAADQAVTFLKAHAQPAPAPDLDRLRKRIADLDSRRFATRTAAAKELAQFGDVARPALQAALKQGPSPEARRQIEALLKARPRPLSDTDLRLLRAAAILERIGSPEARRVLARLAGGAPGARLTHEARAALARLGQR